MPAPRSHVHLFGTARLRWGSDWVDFKRDRRYYLLAYLALQSDGASRERLAYLFWPDAPESRSRHSLRQLLKRVRPLAWVSGLESDQRSVRWRVGSDVADFRAAVDRGAWDEATRLYGGPLLAGIDGGEVPEFATWLELERGALHEIWRESLFRHADWLAREHYHRQAADLLLELVSDDGFDEQALCAFMTAAVRAGRSKEALDAFRSFERRLEQELELEPTRATRALAASLLAPNSAPPTIAIDLAGTGLRRLPQAPTPFIGRDLELAEIVRWLERPSCRLLTLTGLGGVGKSRLALQVGRELEGRYPDGVCFVPLDAVTAAASIPFAVAESIGMDLDGNDDAAAKLAGAIGDRRLLLLLDNYEHLLDGAMLIPDLLASCPGCDVLITSRERLNLAEEWVVEVPGLGLPAAAPPTIDEALAYDAVRLFVTQAERIDHGFRLSREELPHVVEICRRVQGLPLALELAALWTRAMPCSEIAHELGHNLDLLATRLRNVPDRHRSIRAAFEHSWQLLASRERQALSRLSVFRGGFRREAAATIAEVEAPVLASLVDKSLLRAAPSGRYDRHPLLHQFMREKLDEHPDDHAATVQRHASYFLRLLDEHLEAVAGRASAEALQTLEAEFENIAAAWLSAVSGARPQAIGRALALLESFLKRRSRFRELIGLLEQAAASLAGSDCGAELTLAHALILARQGWYVHWLGDYPQAADLSERSLALLEGMGPSPALAQSLNNLGSIAYRTGDHHEARRHFEAARAAARAAAPDEVAGATNNLALAEQQLGNYRQAAAYFEETLALNRSLGRDLQVAINLNNLGDLYLLTGEVERAIPVFEEGLALALAIGFSDIEPYFLLSLASADYERQAYESARGRAEAALARTADRGDGYVQATILNTLGLIDTALDELDRAWTWLERALKLTASTHNLPLLLQTVITVANLELKRGHTPSAVQLLRLALDHPALAEADRVFARKLLAPSEAGSGPARTPPPSGTAAENAGASANALAQQIEALLEVRLPRP